MSGADDALWAHKFSEGGSLFGPEKLQDVESLQAFVAASECNCLTGPHEDAIHDLALTDVPVLVKLIKRQEAEIQLRGRLIGEMAEQLELWLANHPMTGPRQDKVASIILQARKLS